MRWVYVAALVAIQTISSVYNVEAGTGPIRQLVRSVAGAFGNNPGSDTTLRQKEVDPLEALVKGDKDKNIALFFSADWCHFCRDMQPVIADLKAKGYIIYYVNADSNKALLRKFGVQGLPTTVILDKGKETKRFVGVVSKDTLKAALKTRKDQEPKPEEKPVPDYNLQTD